MKAFVTQKVTPNDNSRRHQLLNQVGGVTSARLSIRNLVFRSRTPRVDCLRQVPAWVVSEPAAVAWQAAKVEALNAISRSSWNESQRAAFSTGILRPKGIMDSGKDRIFRSQWWLSGRIMPNHRSKHDRRCTRLSSNCSDTQKTFHTD